VVVNAKFPTKIFIEGSSCLGAVPYGVEDLDGLRAIPPMLRAIPR
jgi:hypothetical protein